jgi:hypothetical protein
VRHRSLCSSMITWPAGLLAAMTVLALVTMLPLVGADAPSLTAGVAKVDITHPDTPTNDPLYAKALVLKQSGTTAVLITVDAVSLGEIGHIKNEFLGNLRAQLKRELGMEPGSVLVNASHCHGVVAGDIEERAFRAVKEAARNMVPVRAGAGRGTENRISENRRLLLKDGSEADVRHAYSMPFDDEVAGIGPVDPEIGLLRLDRMDGRTLAVVYNFACHPIQGVPNGKNTADFPAFASQVIEESLGEGSMAFFVQGCAGDINPVQYKEVHNPRDAETLGNLLGLSALRGVRKIRTGDKSELKVLNEPLTLPRSTNVEARIAKVQAEQARLLKSLQGTSLTFKTFLPMYVQYAVSPEHPSYYSHRYLREKAIGRDDLAKLDAGNREKMAAYLQNVRTMEQLTRLNTNLDLLKMHQKQHQAAGKKTLDVEVAALRVGDFRLVTFPGELTTEIGQHIKKRAREPFTFVAGYTNGYIYYSPTERQLNNSGFAQEDCDTLVAPEWRKLFDEKVDALLNGL